MANKRNSFLFSVCVVLVFFAACQTPPPRTVPEITPHLAAEPVLELPAGTLARSPFVHEQRVGVFDGRGHVLWYEPQTAKVSSTEVEGTVAETFRQGEVIGLRQADRSWVVRQLPDMRLLGRLPKEADRLLGLSLRHVLYRSGGEAHLFDLATETVVTTLPAAAGAPVQGWVGTDAALLLAENQLWRYRFHNRVVDVLKLQEKPLPTMTVDGEHLYFATTGRHFYRFSLRSWRVDWMLTLSEVPLYPPLRIDRTIAVVLRDNTLQFYGDSGSLVWWKQLEAIPAQAPCALRHNLALIDLSGKITFFNPREKTVTPFKNTRNNGPAAALAEALYFVADEGGKTWLFRLKNFLGIGATVTPAGVKALGQSLTITLTTYNLIEPSGEVEIRDPAQKVLLHRRFGPLEKPVIPWVAPAAGTYTLKVRAVGRNGSGEQVTDIQVFDTAVSAADYLFRVLQECTW